MSLLTMIVIFIAVLALSIILFNPGGVIEKFKEMLEILKEEGGKEETLLLSGNKALHVHIGGENGNNIYEFHLFNNLGHKVLQELGSTKAEVTFAINGWKKEKCVVFVSDSSSSPAYLWSIKAIGGNKIYYVDPSSTIQDGITSLEDVLSGHDGRCECISEKEEKREYTLKSSEGCDIPFVKPSHVCWGVKRAIEARFNSLMKDECNKYKKYCPKDGCCSLLYKTDIGNYIYRIKYGIICGYSEDSDEAYWWACTEENSEMKIKASGKEYVCKFEEGIGKWVEA